MRRGALSCRTDPIAINRATRCCYRDFAPGHAPPVIPFLFFLYIVAWIDRVSVGFAALQMNSDLGFSSAAFGFGSGVFFLGYCLFEVPSNPSFVPVGARRWIARIMVSWGAISVAMMFVRIPPTFYVLRLEFKNDEHANHVFRPSSFCHSSLR